MWPCIKELGGYQLEGKNHPSKYYSMRKDLFKTFFSNFKDFTILKFQVKILVNVINLQFFKNIMTYTITKF